MTHEIIDAIKSKDFVAASVQLEAMISQRVSEKLDGVRDVATKNLFKESTDVFKTKEGNEVQIDAPKAIADKEKKARGFKSLNFQDKYGNHKPVDKNGDVVPANASDVNDPILMTTNKGIPSLDGAKIQSIKAE